MKQKLLHIMMGQYNPDLKRGLDSVFECVHFDWLAYGTKSPLLQINFEMSQRLIQLVPLFTSAFSIVTIRFL
jgi:hypothetical protein